jgi:hypothetical protein
VTTIGEIRSGALPRKSRLRSEAEQGVYRKYLVKRLGDRKGKHKRCEYFVLDWKHDRFAVDAMRAYANACAVDFPDLARELHQRCDFWKVAHESASTG